MKRIGILSGLALAALALTNCSTKEIEIASEVVAEKEGVPFEIIALPSVETRTVAGEGLTTTWDATNDKLSVFHRTANTGSFTNDGEFSVADAETGTFSGTITENIPAAGNSYDWVAIYPYDANLTSFAPTNRYYYIGCRSDKAQSQNGTGSNAHLAGYKSDNTGNFPLWGKAENVAYNASASGVESPAISMNQVASVLAFNITNSLDEAISVSSIEFTATEDIVGAYYIDFTGTTPAFSHYETYQSATAKLEVTNGTIAAGETGVFYMGIKPFTVEGTAAEPKTLSMKVTTELGDTQVKTFNVTKSMTFSPNKFKNVNMEWTTEHVLPTDPADYTWVLCKDASTLSAGTEVLIAASDYNFAMNTTQNSNNRGQIGVTKDGDNLTTSSTAQVFTLVTGTANNSYGFQCVNGTNNGSYICAASSSSNHLKTQSDLDGNASWTISITSTGIATVTAQGSYSRKLLQYNTGSGLFACYATDKPQKDISIYTKGDASGSDTKSITSSGTLTVPAIGGEITFPNAYTTQNIEATETINVTSSSNISNISINNGSVTLTMAPNYGNSKVTGESITLTLASDPTVTTTINVEQSGSSLTVNPSTVTIPSDSPSATFTVTSKDFGFSISSSDPSVTVTPSSSEASENAVTITVSSNATAQSTETTLGTLTISRTTDDPQEKTVTVIKGAQAETGSAWIRTAIADLSAGDLIAIVDVTSSRAMSNNNGTSAPSATLITLTTDKSRLSAEPATTLQWVFGGNATDGYTFNVSGTNNYLYCTSTNNGVKVGTNTNRYFDYVKADANSSEYFLKEKETARFIGVYSNQDWRCYTTVNNNIKNTVVAFYKKTGGSSGGTVWNLTGISIETAPAKTSYNAGESFDPTGMVVEANYTEEGNASNTKTETIAIADLTFNPTLTDALTVSNTSVTVSYSDGGVTKTATQSISVSKATPTLVVSPSPVNVYVNGTQQLTVSGSDGTVTYTSSDSNTATVTPAGLVTGKAAGTTTITVTTAATANYNAGSTTVTVNVSDEPDILDLATNNDFQAIFNEWGNSYFNDDSFEYGNAMIQFEDCSRQTTGITGIPVTKTGYVAVKMKNNGVLSSISFTLLQWTNKTHTATLEYSTNGGNSYSAFSPSITHTTSNKTTGEVFTLSSTTIPSGTNAVRVIVSSGSGLGIKSISFE